MFRNKGQCEIEFRYHRPEALEVYLVSDFNGWDPYSLPMVRTSGGTWVCRARLHKGVYQMTPLVVLASGEWSVDHAAFVFDWSSSGSGRIVVLGDRASASTEHPLVLSIRPKRHARVDRFQVVLSSENTKKEEIVL
jgi:hypothetical protein